MFDDFVTDAISVLDYFKSKKEFGKIFVIGHSQGSLVGMLAAKGKADGFISLAGAGQTIDKVITDQITKTAPMFTEDTNRVFKSLREGNTISDFPPALASVFRLDIQPFIMNWMQYDPQAIIKELKIPILIINGTKDIQVPVTYANLLKQSNPKAELVVIDKMNHVLVPIDGDTLENTKAYNEPLRELSKELIPAIIAFIK
jgi:pimeloyl-ACP methyl ester carboxylesterase